MRIEEVEVEHALRPEGEDEPGPTVAVAEFDRAAGLLATEDASFSHGMSPNRARPCRIFSGASGTGLAETGNRPRFPRARRSTWRYKDLRQLGPGSTKVAG